MLHMGYFAYLAVVVFFSDTNTEQREQRTIGCLDINTSFNHGPVCHFLTMEDFLSWVRSMPWQLIRLFFFFFCLEQPQ